MTVFAVTGHMDLCEHCQSLIRDDLKKKFSDNCADELSGVSCLARGADSIFAEVLLDTGGQLIVVLPSHDYRKTKVKADHADAFDHLSSQASETIVMDFKEAGRQAYEAANEELLKRADRLVAIWDGSPPSGKGGGTADTVVLARSRNIPVDVLWPSGCARTGH